MKAARDCVLGLTVLDAQAGYRPIGGDWWVAFAVALLALEILRTVTPQHSEDRLALWRDLRPGRNLGASGRPRRSRRDRTRRDPRGVPDRTRRPGRHRRARPGRAPRPRIRPRPPRPR